ncbi:MAG: 23S rRNA (adenine(2503)-C(2))-methyltransferase RlmN [Bordetella sp.]|nr:MAG: 23S rRNA (adenine(2503)-C(2))-methyltransferase RlmN [Bordetella sp.]
MNENVLAERINLIGLDYLALSNLMQKWGYQAFRTVQLQKWIHRFCINSFESMTDLSFEFRKFLTERAFIEALPIHTQKYSSDGTVKWLFDVGTNNLIETVFIPENDRGTLCISSQIGCTVNCKFCATGYQGFNRNLNTNEIISQIWLTKYLIEKSHSFKKKDINHKYSHNNFQKITNVVFMGMGEPLLNYKEVLPALRLLVDDNAYALSRRRVTISTSGIVPIMDRLSKDCPVALAVSLHAANDSLRDELVPINKKYPLKCLLEACERYLVYAPRKFLTFEYCMIDSVNDTEKHVKELINLARQISCKINLIPFNSFQNSGFKCSSLSKIYNFVQKLNDAGIVTTVRKTRGIDIDAACGQLVGKVFNRITIRKQETYIN